MLTFCTWHRNRKNKKDYDNVYYVLKLHQIFTIFKKIVQFEVKKPPKKLEASNLIFAMKLEA